MLNWVGGVRPQFGFVWVLSAHGDQFYRHLLLAPIIAGINSTHIYIALWAVKWLW